MSTLFRVRTAITGGPGGAELSTQFFNAASTTEQDAADAVRAFWATCASRISAAYTFQVESLVYSIDSANGQATSTAGTTTLPVTGGDLGEKLPGNVNGVVRVHTGLFIAGRELTGKIWIPGPTENYNASGVPDSTYRSVVDGALNAMLVTPANGYVVWSRKHFQFFAVTSGSTWTQWGTLRSRRQ